MQHPLPGVVPPTLRSWLGNQSIRLKLNLITAVYVTIILALLAVATVASGLNNGVRAYVQAEGLWSKGQKDAVYYLTRYAQLQDEADYQKYLRAISVPLGDRTARLELQKASYDYSVAERGFIEGGNALEDIPYMISFFRRFQNVGDLEKAISIWTEADAQIAQLARTADQIRSAIADGRFSAERESELVDRIEQINARVTPIQIAFSATLSEAARTMRVLVLMVILLVAVGLLGIGLAISMWISRELRSGLEALRVGARRVAEGNLSIQIPVRSSDEIGVLTGAFNDMIMNRRRIEATLTKYSDELERSNKELEQFGYVASHDLQAPLRSILGFSQLLERDLLGKLSKDAEEYLKFIIQSATHMSALIKDLLAYSRIGHEAAAFVPTDCEDVLRQVETQLHAIIGERSAQITHDPLPVIPGTILDINQLFQNLIGNAIKFQSGDKPKVHVSAQREGDHWKFSVRDYGIGLKLEDQERIFQIFQRLHSADKYQGTGIGLAICQKIVNRHGGRIWVESEFGKGATFYFTLMA